MHDIVVCSSYQNDEANLILAREYCKWVLDHGENPFAGHLMYPKFLREDIPEERAIGIELCKQRVRNCYEMWVFSKEGVLTPGMVDECKHALIWSVPCRWFDATDQDNIVELKHLSSNKIPSKAELLAPKPFVKMASDTLAEVAKALKEGKRYEDLQDALESFLGPVDASESDPEKDQEWENEYRNGRS
jgi:hypothetical protein